MGTTGNGGQLAFAPALLSVGATLLFQSAMFLTIVPGPPGQVRWDRESKKGTYQLKKYEGKSECSSGVLRKGSGLGQTVGN
jgi:hypothetical protein